MQVEHFTEVRPEAGAEKHTRRLPIHWHTYEPFIVPLRPRCLKLPRARFTRFVRQQVSRG